MNTAVARRLALGDRVVWIGKDDYQPSGPGTITRITAHQVEVLWEDETARRYRRTQLHNLRHSKFTPTGSRLRFAALSSRLLSILPFFPPIDTIRHHAAWPTRPAGAPSSLRDISIDPCDLDF